ncbi:ComEA family DNA-binding protein [Paenibacillus sp. GCM10027627]|uniref:ComEA family DNA-binding protein n=1 Tax=unclassified Paenibacillus TaxID=185978 RepID=UPI003642E0F3
MSLRLARRNRQGGKWTAAICLAGAALLMVAAFVNNKPNEEAGWIPLNEAVEASLSQGDAETGTGGARNSAPSKNAFKEEASNDSKVEESNDSKGKAGGSAGTEQPDQKSNEPDSNGDKSELKSFIPQHSSIDANGKLDINRASAAELDALKGIGPAKAAAIVDDRERNGYFGSVDELLRVKGIGEKLLEGIKESVVARPGL